MTPSHIIDAHVHIWAREDRKADKLKSKIPILRNDYLLGDLKQETSRNPATRFILVQTCSDFQETEELLTLAQDEDMICGVVGWLDLADQRSRIDDRIGRFQQWPKFCGVRTQRADCLDTDWPSIPQLNAGFQALEKAGIPLDLLMDCHELPSLEGLAHDFPELQFVINHFARPLTAAGDVAQWSADIKAVAAHGNVVCKLSGLIERAGMDWSPQTLFPWIAEAISVFGTDRLMFASNWPVVNVMGSYVAWLNAVQECFERIGLSVQERDQILSANSARVYGI